MREEDDPKMFDDTNEWIDELTEAEEEEETAEGGGRREDAKPEIRSLPSCAAPSPGVIAREWRLAGSRPSHRPSTVFGEMARTERAARRDKIGQFVCLSSLLSPPPSLISCLDLDCHEGSWQILLRYVFSQYMDPIYAC